MTDRMLSEQPTECVGMRTRRWDADELIQKAEDLVRLAAEDGAQVILLQELFQTPYSCLEEKYEYLPQARPLAEDRAVQHSGRSPRR